MMKKCLCLSSRPSCYPVQTKPNFDRINRVYGMIKKCLRLSSCPSCYPVQTKPDFDRINRIYRMMKKCLCLSSRPSCYPVQTKPDFDRINRVYGMMKKCLCLSSCPSCYPVQKILRVFSFPRFSTIVFPNLKPVSVEAFLFCHQFLQIADSLWGEAFISGCGSSAGDKLIDRRNNPMVSSSQLLFFIQPPLLEHSIFGTGLTG
jgi:hypothetical protein